MGLVLAGSGLLSPPLALTAGLVFGFTFTHPYQAGSRKLAKSLLQASVVGLGFGMNLEQVLRAGRSGIAYTAASITLAMLMGWLLGRLLKVQANSSFLICAGTAICGGSAIAALGPIAEASEEDMAVSLGTIFVLNSIALIAFPLVGRALGLTQTQFGLWSALAIHDTSSVVGAAAKYGVVALAVGTTVKLARALWIVPVSIAAAAVKKSRKRVQWPWFILFFCLAALANTYLSRPHAIFLALNSLGKMGLTATLFLIGTGLSRTTLRQVGIRPLAQGILLWIIVAAGSLALIRAGWIGL